MAKVSVIIATHSRPHLLPRAVKSAQDAGRNIEVVVVDDASTDNTREVCNGLPDIRYVRLDRNQRVAGARNVGILASTGDYISFLDDDDVRFPGSIDAQISEISRIPGAGLAYGKVVVGDSDGIATNEIEPVECPVGDVFWRLLGHNFIHCLSAVFRRECLFKVGLLDSNLAGMDDWDLWVRIAELYPVVALTEPVGIWRSFEPDSDQGSARIAEIFSRAARVQVNKWFRLPRASAVERSVRDAARERMLSRFSDVLISHAATVLPKGHSAHARRCLQTALLLHPRRAARPWTFALLARTLLRTSRLSDERRGSDALLGE